MARVNIQVEQVTVAVEEFVGGEGIDTKVALDGRLLLGGQVVVGNVGAADVVLLDDEFGVFRKHGTQNSALFLIDRDGTIIAVPNSVEELEAKLKEIFPDNK